MLLFCAQCLFVPVTRRGDHFFLGRIMAYKIGYINILILLAILWTRKTLLRSYMGDEVSIFMERSVFMDQKFSIEAIFWAIKWVIKLVIEIY